MGFDFKGEVAIITGAGQGIGFQIAKELALSGASVLLNDLDRDLVDLAAKKLSDAGGDVIAHSGDASSPEFIREMVEKAVSTFGKLTLAIANAGITLFGDFLDYPPASFFKVLELNLGGSFFLAQAAAAQMIKQKSGGSILFTSSVTGHQAHRKLAAYGMTKAALEMLAKNLVIELSPSSITVNCIAPGATLTERTRQEADYESTWQRLTPTGRPATVEDISNAALFLLAPASRQITGQTIIIDGGWTSVSPSPYETDQEDKN